MPSEIASLPDLQGYIAFAGAYDIARIELKLMNFVNRMPGVVVAKEPFRCLSG